MTATTQTTEAPVAVSTAPPVSPFDYLDQAKVYLDQPNSAGGVDLWIVFTNAASGTIKYATFTVTPYNAVGDAVSSEIGGLSQARLKYTGPVASNASDAAKWETIWYNPSITRVEVDWVEIEYMDGTTVEFTYAPATLGADMYDNPVIQVHEDLRARG